MNVYARVAELVDAQDLKSWGFKKPCQFKSGLGHIPLLLFKKRSKNDDKAIQCDKNTQASSSLAFFLFFLKKEAKTMTKQEVCGL